MISVIIPTMWRAPGVFLQALNNYINHPLIGEIIIINNDEGKTPPWPELRHAKVRLWKFGRNIYVNPAWNFGVEQAIYDKFCFANDDIVVDNRLFDKIYDRIIPENGTQGILTGEAIHNHPPTTDGTIDFKEWQPGDNIHCFGQMFFIHRENWIPIIPGLDIFFGDDFVFHWHLYKGLKNYLIYNIHFFSPMAQTTKDRTLIDGFGDRERPIWYDWFMKHPLK